MPISIFSVPEKITIELGKGTLDLFNRLIDIYNKNKEVKELMNELNISSDALKKTVDENPDPNPRD